MLKFWLSADAPVLRRSIECVWRGDEEDPVGDDRLPARGDPLSSIGAIRWTSDRIIASWAL